MSDTPKSLEKEAVTRIDRRIATLTEISEKERADMDGFDVEGIRAERPNVTEGGAQTAVGEGELPELVVTDADMAAARQVFGGRPTSLAVTREMQDLVLQRTTAEIICRERQLRDAIAQGSAAFQSQAEWKQCALDAEAKLAESTAQRDEARSGEAFQSDRLFERYQNSGVARRFTFSGWMNQRITDCEAAEARLAALDVPKLEELMEHIKSELSRMNKNRMPPWQKELLNDINARIDSRLRSLLCGGGGPHPREDLKAFARGNHIYKTVRAVPATEDTRAPGPQEGREP